MSKHQLLLDLFFCYLEARRHKRHTASQIKFERNLEDNLVNLCEDIYNERYVISPCIYFIHRDPIQREVFAWNFRDRVVHHLIYNYLSPYYEKQFIYDSYSCRKNKWTSMGIQRISKFMRSCSDNYTQQWRILKMDIQWYFMSINRNILYNKINHVIQNWENLPWMKKSWIFDTYTTPLGVQFPKYLRKVLHDIIYHDPTKHWIFKWKLSDYNWLPKTKSLFHAKPNCGLPIWNLTSQLFSNIYLNEFDHFIKDSLNIKYYWRYVDDFVIIHTDKNYLLSTIPIIKDYLSSQLKLTLHPNKIYIQPISHWVKFLWATIKPYCIYHNKRTIKKFCKILKDTNYCPWRESLDSYLWILSHYNHHKFIIKSLEKIRTTNPNQITDYAQKFLNLI